MYEQTIASSVRFQARRVPLIYRIAMPLLVAMTLLTCCVELLGRSSPVCAVFDPPPELLPGKQQFPSLAGCSALHDGRFVCHLTLRGSTIELTYDGIVHQIIYTAVSTPDQKLGDLIVAWGEPTGFTRSGQTLAVSWSTRTAYLAPHSFQPDTQVMRVTYDDKPKQTSPWHGFVSQVFTSETE